jgi:hypothetical protein
MNIIPNKDNALSINDTEPFLNKNVVNDRTLNKEENNLTNKFKKGATLLKNAAYNSTIQEAKNGRVPIADTLWRTFYRKLWNPKNSYGPYVFSEKEGYRYLGGSFRSHSKRKSKKYTIKRKNKKQTRKNK